ncbi:DUF4376 domain-containing protein [Mannheimia indoligenes]|uniref:DUF4376 domain-containing protein n=1 Tax=Mannheimia indoligenes TaxID=3103145 RepID=UPI002FE67F64
MYYIFDAKGNFLASSNSKPNLDDLASRCETATESVQAYIEPFYDGLKIIDKGTVPSKYHTWNGTEWTISPEQQAVKKAEEIAIVRERINTLRDEKSAGGVYVEQLGKWFDSDDKAQKKLLGLKATMDLVGEIMVSWTCADNTDLEDFGKAHLTAVIAAILQAENHNHTVARQHKANLEQADNPLEYDYSAGWAKTYEDFLNEQTEKLSLS